jgi:hypothetical protein
MKVILNKCFGGFGLSYEAYKLYAKKKGLELFAYELGPNLTYRRANAKEGFLVTYTTRDCGDNPKFADETAWKDVLHLGSEHREDPVLIEVVEELGDKANTPCSHLRIVNIPDGMDTEKG